MEAFWGEGRDGGVQSDHIAYLQKWTGRDQEDLIPQILIKTILHSELMAGVLGGFLMMRCNSPAL